MIGIMLVGVALWWAGHVFKRLAPAQRGALASRLGDASKGVVAVVLVLSVVLMVYGFRRAEVIPVYEAPSWGRHLNNLLMLASVALFGLGSSKSRLRAKMRHPMLTGFLVWAIAHLLANGDLASVLMFGLLGLWAVVSMILINRAEPIWTPWQGGSKAGDIRLGVITLVVYAVIAGVHTWLGYWPFPG